MTDPLEDPEKLAIFVQEYVRHEGQDDAAVIAMSRAGLRDPRFHPVTLADRVLAKPEIQAAIRAVRAVSKPEMAPSVTAESLLNDMESLFQKCLDERQYTPAIAAKKLQGELMGLLKRDVNVTFTHRVEDMSTAELMKIASRGKNEVDGEFTDITPKD